MADRRENPSKFGDAVVKYGIPFSILGYLALITSPAWGPLLIGSTSSEENPLKTIKLGAETTAKRMQKAVEVYNNMTRF